ncbi:hypothetical protein [Streptomyces sp. NPDC056713]|uniref:hypothetical protein n=1 Tax=Streptomyces sp. NPDC056713 TaxID=3345921 RepID=UPI003687ED34
MSEVVGADASELDPVCGDGYPIADDPKAGYTGEKHPCHCDGQFNGGQNYHPADIFPGVSVPTKWHGRKEFTEKFYTFIHDYEKYGKLPGYLTDGSNPDAATAQLGWWALQVCWEMKTCPQSVQTKFQDMSSGLYDTILAAGGGPRSQFRLVYPRGTHRRCCGHR